EKMLKPGSTFATVTADGLGLGRDDVDMEDLAAAESELPNTFLTSFALSSEKNQGCHSATKKSNDAAMLSNLAETFKAAVEDQGKHVQVLANAMSDVNEQVNLGRMLKSLGNLLEFGRGKGGIRSRYNGKLLAIVGCTIWKIKRAFKNKNGYQELETE
ncbi:hypothetical protein HN873_025248, partial [Arachis hypogaea]